MSKYDLEKYLPCYSLHQPWASLVIVGAKRSETRNFPPPERLIGERIGIHAAVRDPLSAIRVITDGGSVSAVAAIDEALSAECGGYGSAWNQLPRGALLGTARIAWAARATTTAQDGRSVLLAQLGDAIGPVPMWARVDHFGDYSRGRWVWRLEDVRRFDQPIPYKGKQGVWYVPRDLVGEARG